MVSRAHTTAPALCVPCFQALGQRQEWVGVKARVCCGSDNARASQARAKCSLHIAYIFLMRPGWEIKARESEQIVLKEGLLDPCALGVRERAPQ